MSPTVKRLSPQEFEIVDLEGDETAYVRKEGDRWILDVFGPDFIQPAEKAWISSETFETKEEAFEELGVEP